MGERITHLQLQNVESRSSSMATPRERAIVSEQPSPKSLGPQTRPSLAIKRARDPPRNEIGQIYCDHADCRNNVVVFRRPCEWNKHMDKHDRPYKCLDTDCAKLPGFTYSGGLLRHQREVHKMHTQGKKLMCPFPDCNRSSGKGFTRHENLKEHLRRLHRLDERPANDNNATDYDSNNNHNRHTNKTEISKLPIIPRIISTNTLPTPTSMTGGSEFATFEDRISASISAPSAAKRKRVSESSSSYGSEENTSEVRTLRHEVARLRHQVYQKDSRLDELERTVSELRQRIHNGRNV